MDEGAWDHYYKMFLKSPDSESRGMRNNPFDFVVPGGCHHDEESDATDCEARVLLFLSRDLMDCSSSSFIACKQLELWRSCVLSVEPKLSSLGS
jgi:hypothetical protein